MSSNTGRIASVSNLVSKSCFNLHVKSASAAAYGAALSISTAAIVICLRPVPISAEIGVISTWKKSRTNCLSPICRRPVMAAAIIVSKSTPFTSSPA